VYNATTDDWRTHPAIDFNVADGSQIKSISTGIVIKIYDDVLLGTVAEIDHGNGVIARYCGLNKDTVEIKEGNTLTQGQVIGYLGTVPFEKSEISHLHFETKHNGEYVDPLELMGK
jgi:stage II sporulation protein Q